jgi:hypothetical protein
MRETRAAGAGLDGLTFSTPGGVGSAVQPFHHGRAPRPVDKGGPLKGRASEGQGQLKDRAS